MTTTTIPDQTQIIQFSSTDGSLELGVSLQQESVWLSLNQMADLFERDKSVISRHIKKIFAEEEWERDQTVAFFATVQKEGSKQVERLVEHFSLDIILSVGYRVNSKRGIEFRRWSNRVLKDYLFKGYAFNQRHLLQKGFEEVHQSLELLKRSFDQIETADIQKSSIEIIQAYAKSWSLLLAYDENRLGDFHQQQDIKPLAIPSLASGVDALKQDLMIKGEASELFGKLRGSDNITSILYNIHQTFDGNLLYPSLQERAAHLLYMVIKNHPFIDGNKRIGCFLFLTYLKIYAIPVSLFTNEALVALALLTAQSDPKDKDLMTKLIMHVIPSQGQTHGL
jgi:prophage maintenance system killer protein